MADIALQHFLQPKPSKAKKAHLEVQLIFFVRKYIWTNLKCDDNNHGFTEYKVLHGRLLPSLNALQYKKKKSLTHLLEFFL